MTITFTIANGDVVVDASTGRPKTVADRTKLSQDLDENFGIAQQASGFGAGLDGLIGLLGDQVSLRSELDLRVRSSLRAMQQLQQRYQRAQRPADERIARLALLKLYPVVQNGQVQASKTGYAFRVDVLTEQGAGTSGVTSGGVIIG